MKFSSLVMLHQDHALSTLDLAAFRRKDWHELNARICQVNEISSEEIIMHGFDSIPNENILYSNLN